MKTNTQQMQPTLLPHTIDEHMRQENITLPQIRRVIPEECLKPNALRSYLTLIRVVGCMAVCLYLLSRIQLDDGLVLFWQIPALTILWILYGWVLVGLFVIGHDCGHRSFSPKKWINTLIGYICMSPLANSFHTWCLTHDHHHAYTQLRGQEVDWASNLVTREEFESPNLKTITRLGYHLPFGIFLWIAWNTVRRGLTVHTFLTPKQWAKQKSRLLGSNAIMITFLLTIYSSLWYGCGFWGMLKYHGIPATIAMFTGWVIITIQHASEHSLLYEETGWTPARGQLVSTFDIRFPAWLEYLWCDINIHIPHHIAPGIPWYALKKAGRTMRQAFPAYYQEQTFGLHHLMWFYRTPFLKKMEDKGYYVLDISSHVR